MKAVPNEGYFFAGKSKEIVSLVKDRPPIPPGLLMEAFDTLLCIRVSSLQAPTKGAQIQFEFDISEYILICFFFWNVDLNWNAMARHGPILWENDATRPKIISKYRVGFRRPRRYIKTD